MTSWEVEARARLDVRGFGACISGCVVVEVVVASPKEFGFAVPFVAVEVILAPHKNCGSWSLLNSAHSNSFSWKISDCQVWDITGAAMHFRAMYPPKPIRGGKPTQVHCVGSSFLLTSLQCCQVLTMMCVRVIL